MPKGVYASGMGSRICEIIPFPTEQTADWKRDSTNRGCVIVDEEVGRFARAYQN